MRRHTRSSFRFFSFGTFCWDRQHFWHRIRNAKIGFKNKKCDAYHFKWKSSISIFDISHLFWNVVLLSFILQSSFADDFWDKWHFLDDSSYASVKSKDHSQEEISWDEPYLYVDMYSVGLSQPGSSIGALPT